MFKFGLLLEHSDSKNVNVLEHESVKVEAFRLKTTFPRGKMFCKQKQILNCYSQTNKDDDNFLILNDNKKLYKKRKHYLKQID